MNPLTPYLAWIKPTLALLIVSVVFVGGCRYGAASGKANLAQQRAKAEQTIADYAKAETVLVQKARKAEQDKAQAVAAIATQYEQDRTNDQAAHARDLAGLASSNDRLRSHWQGCKATADVSGTSTAAFIADAAEQLRNTDAADLIGIGREADTKERALQAVIVGDRK